MKDELDEVELTKYTETVEAIYRLFQIGPLNG
jgi:hypothetical protein